MNFYQYVSINNIKLVCYLCHASVCWFAAQANAYVTKALRQKSASESTLI